MGFFCIYGIIASMTGEVHWNDNKNLVWGGYMFLPDQGSGAPHGAHICNGHAEFFSGSVGAGASYSVVPPWRKKRISSTSIWYVRICVIKKFHVEKP